MTRRDAAPAPGIPCWIDLSAVDLDRTIDFYTSVFGWRAERGDAEYGGYTMFYLGDAAVAGAGPKQPDDPTPVDFWVVYLRSADLAGDVAAAAANGGTVILESLEVPAMGRMAVLQDPSGATVCLWEPLGHHGFSVVDEPGAPSWFELASRDPDAAEAFYAATFGWTYSTGPVEMRYDQASVGDELVAGVMDARPFLPEGVPSHWAFYLLTDDMDATVQKITDGGGTIMMGPDESPFGKLLWATDPSGASFKVQSRA